MPDRPLISIVTPCFNRAAMVAEAVESVLTQGYPQFEHIVADGGSKDGTLEVLKRYPHLRVLSEPDKSLYDAVNKGIRLARGTVIGFLNTDDAYAPNVFRPVGDAFTADPNLDMVYGGSAVFEQHADGSKVILSTVTEKAELEFSPWKAAFRPIWINARFFHRRVYERVGLYDWTYKIAGDREFFLRAGLSLPMRARFLDQLLYLCRHHAQSLTFNDATFSETISREHVKMVTSLLRNPDWRARAGTPLRRLHTVETLGLVAHEFRRRRWLAALRYGLQGWSQDARWPVEFVTASVRRLCGGRTKSHR